MSSSIKSAVASILDREKSRLDNLQKLTDVLNPASTLKRGYSITKIGGKAVSDIKAVKTGDIIETLTDKGSIISTVSETHTT